MSKQFWGIIIAIAILFTGVVALNNNSDTGGKSGSSAKPTNHIEGKSPKGVKLVEYGDFQCSACGAFYPTVEQVVKKYQDSVQFQFRNLPLTSLHQNAFAAARAAEAADQQGKFWEMYRLLYQNQNEWSEREDAYSIFKGYAESLGLKLDKFATDYNSSAVNNAINADVAAFKKTGDDMATPTFYLNGKKLDNNSLADPATGQAGVEAFSKLLDKALAE